MPCFNAEGTLEEALRSIVNQDVPSLEIVLVDDGSTDQTPALLARWEQKDPRVRLLRCPHGGIVRALNAGLERCRGEYIARMDADDRSLPGRLAKQLTLLEENPDLAAAGCLVKSFPAESVRRGFEVYLQWLNSLVTPEQIAREIYVESPLAHPSVTVRRAWLDQVGGYQDHGWPEDYDLWLRLHLLGARFAKVPEVLFSWREHPDRLTWSDSRYSVRNFLRAKAHYLCRGPLADRDAVILWGAGQMGRRLSKHLSREGAPLVAFVDIDPKKIGRQKRGRPVISPEDLLTWWKGFRRPVLLAAVGARGARALIREQLEDFGLKEGKDWWAAA
jgi:glycosyltransferase involved in cell wall biosynthesis